MHSFITFVTCVLLCTTAITSQILQCQVGYKLVGTQCHSTDPNCNRPNFLTTTTTRPFGPCIVSPTHTEIITQCPSGSYYDGQSQRCIHIDVLVICPKTRGWRQEGNRCFYDVPITDTYDVEVICPVGTIQRGNRCIYTAPPVTTESMCPIGSQKRGGVCVMDPVQVICADGSMPSNGMCKITGTMYMKCPPGSNKISENECQMVPPHVKYICPDGSLADHNNACPINVPPVEYVCPEGAQRDYLNRCIIRVDGGIKIVCPHDSIQEGNYCKLVPRIPDVKYICPHGSEQPSSNTCVYRIPAKTYEVDLACPSGMRKEGLDKCVQYIDSNTCTETHQNTGYDNVDNECNQQQPTVIHNHNPVHAPTNITSTNINNITILSTDCGNGQRERIIMINGKTERVPCPQPIHVPQPIHIPQPYPVHVPMQQEPCCTVQSPRMCSTQGSQWQCGHRQSQRCGSFCSDGNIMLRKRRSTYKAGMLIMAPKVTYKKLKPSKNINCFGCLAKDYKNCTPECYTYQCQDGKCGHFIDQDEFCAQNGPGPGCDTTDGYYTDE